MKSLWDVLSPICYCNSLCALLSSLWLLFCCHQALVCDRRRDNLCNEAHQLSANIEFRMKIFLSFTLVVLTRLQRCEREAHSVSRWRALLLLSSLYSPPFHAAADPSLQ